MNTRPCEQKTIFKKIIDREVPEKLVYEDDLLLAFHDVNPQAPVHVLIIPKKCFPTLNAVTTEDELCLGRMLCVASKLAAQLSIAEGGYRVVINCNADAGQEIHHLHMHLLGGCKLKSLG